MDFFTTDFNNEINFFVKITPIGRYWRRYIYLWINYALYQELDIGDMEKTRDVYKVCLQVIPHKKFTFSKIWVMFAYFEVRQLRLSDARKIMVCFKIGFWLSFIWNLILSSYKIMN